jgi:hypothetical protein
MQLDTFGKVFLVQHTQGNFVKFQIYPTTDLKRKMAIGTIALDESEMLRLYQVLQAIVEKREHPSVEVKDMRGLKKANDEYRVRTEQANRSEPISAEEIQRQNLVAEGRLEPQEIGAVAEVVKKEKKRLFE